MKSVETIQAIWRGWSARAVVTPVLLVRRRELHERRCLEKEEEDCIRVAAVEAKRATAEHERQKAELKAMRYIPLVRSARGAAGHAVGCLARLVGSVFHTISMLPPEVPHIAFQYPWEQVDWNFFNCSGAMKREHDAAGSA